MPYKDPERKRRWEREHRESRNARRRKQMATGLIMSSTHTRVPDPVSNPEMGNAWPVVTGIASILVTAAFAVLALKWPRSDS